MTSLFENEREENKETSEPSGSTGGSTDSSTPSSTSGSTSSVEPVQVPDLPDLNEKYSRKNWNYYELKKIISQRMRKSIIFHSNRLRSKSIIQPNRIEVSIEFFQKNFPNRSPFAVYQKALLVERDVYKRIKK